MGANFAPNLANLFMARWEEDMIFSCEWPGLTFYQRNIDDIILAWNAFQMRVHFSLRRGVDYIWGKSILKVMLIARFYAVPE